MTSDPYLYPGTTVLRNALGIRNSDELRRVEAELTRTRSVRLAGRPLPGQYDLGHLQRFHRTLFEGLYDWAGELRNIAIAKTDLFCLPQYLQSYGHDVFAELARDNQLLRGLRPDVFVERLAHHLGNVNALHPFREGNGRAQHAFFTQLADQAGYHIDWHRLDPDHYTAAQVAALSGDETPLRDALATITTPQGRPGAASGDTEIAALRRLHRANFPVPPQPGPRPGPSPTARPGAGATPPARDTDLER